ncbi:hypothetical protein [Nocardia nepalensis]|uniref:hypothetical protein n=1 Tax=Nocardia nepalensis TaxID=3375448 RepID=UPI003B66F9C7
MVDRTKLNESQSRPLDDCGWEPERLDWETARTLWGIHSSHAPNCKALLAAGAALSARPDED